MASTKRKAPRRYPQKGRKPTATRPSRGAIQKKSTKLRSCATGGSSSQAQASAPRPTYFSLLKDVENYLRVDHAEGASMQKLKREMEKRYGGQAFGVDSCKMLKSAVKRLQNRGRIKKTPNSTLLKFKPPIVPAYNFFGNDGSKGVRVVPLRVPPPSRRPALRKQVVARKPMARTPPPIRPKHLMARAPPIRKHAPKRPTQSYRPPIRRRR